MPRTKGVRPTIAQVERVQGIVNKLDTIIRNSSDLHPEICFALDFGYRNLYQALEMMRKAREE